MNQNYYFIPLEIYVILIFFYFLRTIYDNFFFIFANLVGVISVPSAKRDILT